MSLPEHRIRRATLEDREALKKMWASMHFDVTDLARRLTEFQVAEGMDGKLLGAVGFQIANSQGWLHSEAFTDFGLADGLRSLFWKRLQSVASNHGVLRVWTRENSSFWIQLGFQAASAGALQKLPESWNRSAVDWLTLPLKDENAIASIEREIALFMTAEKQRTEKVIGQAKTFKTIVTVIGFLLAFAIFGVAVWLYFARNTGGPPAPP